MKQRKNRLTKEQKQQKRLENRTAMKQEVREHPYLTAAYFLLRLAVVAVMVLQFFNKEYYDVFLCGLTLVMFLIPSFVEKRLHIDVPNVLEVIILLFIFAAEILGEIREYYLIYPFWDTILHTLNGFLMAAIGIAMVDILNRSDKFKVRLSPAFVALVAFCFSMTIGVLWEFFEYGMDTFLHLDMQKDTVLHSITSVMLNPDGRNRPVTVPIESIVVNGEEWGGYIDIGLHDTMEDLLVNFIGAAVFSVIGMLYIMGRGKGKFAPKFIPRLKTDELPAPDEEKPSLFSPVALGSGTTVPPSPDCVFCKIVSGEGKCHKIYEDELTMAFLDIADDAEGHTLVIPKEHAQTLMDCRPETAEALIHTVQLVAKHYTEHCGYEGVNILNASGSAAQQSVGHLHFHIIPRKKNDKLDTWCRKLRSSSDDLQTLCGKLTLMPDQQNEN